MGTKELLQQVGWGQLKVHMQKLKLDPDLTPPSTAEVDGRPEHIAKAVKCRIDCRENLHDLGLGNAFLQMTQEGQATKEKNIN
jgi:hypothetical protein